MNISHKVIIIPGSGDTTGMLQLATGFWRIYRLEPVVHSVGWRDGEKEFEPKLQRLVALIDRFAREGNTVSLVGTSAGGSAVLNAFVERKNTVHKVVNVCGRVRTGKQKGLRSFEKMTATSPAFARSVKLFEIREPMLTKKDRTKIMTVRALFGDELVPADTTVIRGAHNTTVPTPEHVFSITMALTIFSKPIISFLRVWE